MGRCFSSPKEWFPDQFFKASISLHTAHHLPLSQAFFLLTGMQFEVTGEEFFYFCKYLLEFFNRDGMILLEFKAWIHLPCFRGEKRLPFHTGHQELSE